MVSSKQAKLSSRHNMKVLFLSLLFCHGASAGKITVSRFLSLEFDVTAVVSKSNTQKRDGARKFYFHF